MHRLGIGMACYLLFFSLMGCSYYGGDVRRANHEDNYLIPQAAREGQQVINENAIRHDPLMNERMNSPLQQRSMELVKTVEGVNDATIIVNGFDIIVGLETDQEYEHTAVENEVNQVLQNTYERYSVHVTSSHELVEKIKSIKGQMAPLDGHPMRNLAQNLNELLKEMH